MFNCENCARLDISEGIPICGFYHEQLSGGLFEDHPYKRCEQCNKDGFEHFMQCNRSRVEELYKTWMGVIPEGWHKLFYMMLTDIDKYDELGRWELIDVKEKYGEMRVAYTGGNKEINDIIEKYQWISQYVCEDCGMPATRESKGWIKHMCEDCWKDHGGVQAFIIDKKLVYCIQRWKNGIMNEEKHDCSDIWYRLYGEEEQ